MEHWEPASKKIRISYCSYCKEPVSKHKYAGYAYLAKCCNTIIQSLHQHHVCNCDCGSCYVDGGGYYGRLGFPDGQYSDWLEMIPDDDDGEEKEEEYW